MNRIGVTRLVVVLPALALAGLGCNRRPPSITTRLVDLFRPELVVGSVGPSMHPPREAWLFDAPAIPGLRFEAGPGVSGLEVRDGHLHGRATTAFPIVHLETSGKQDDLDALQRVEIRMRASRGTNLAIGFSGKDHLDLNDPDLLTPSTWPLHSPIIAGNDWTTYVLPLSRGVPMTRTRHVLVLPSDEAGAGFAIESLRLVSRKEHLASFPSGVSWQGLSEFYRESIVARTPESIRFSLTMPKKPWMELAVGSVDEEPVTFRVAVGAPGRESVLSEHTVTTPYRWEPVSVDLGSAAGRKVSVVLSLSAGRSGVLGLWGGPVVRSLGAMPAPSAPAKAPSAPPQGVLVIWVDTLRRDHLNTYGYERETDPTIRRMASEGTLFRDAVSQATWTKVSTPSFLTSLYPATHGVHDFNDRLPNAALTLAEVYRQAGYATLSMSSGLFTGRFTNLHKGFEEVQENGSIKGEARTSKTARVFVDRLLPWLEAHRGVPFFVFLHVQDPHDPYRPSPPYDTLWTDAATGARHERQGNDLKKFISDPLMKGFLMPSRDELLRAGLKPEEYEDCERAWYDGSIRGLDAEIGRLMEGLRNLGLDRRTLVVYTADHGEEFLEHGSTFHGQSTYGELTNVPLILWQPGTLAAGAVVDQTVQLIDVMPTVLEMSRLPVPARTQGHSLISLLTGPASSPQPRPVATARSWPAVTEKAATHEGGGPPPRESESYAIVAEGWKLIHNQKGAAGRPEYELFDHFKDPLDSTNLAPNHPDLVRRLGAQLEAWYRMAIAARIPPDSHSNEGLGTEELERLRALGYIQ